MPVGPQLPADGDWPAVAAAVQARRTLLGLTIAGLSRSSGVSETTIRSLYAQGKRNRTTLVALSAALGFQHFHLENVLRGQADDGELPVPPGPEGRLAALETAVTGISETLARLTDMLADLAVRLNDGGPPRS